MQQYGQQFVQSFLLPHIIGKILPKVGKDKDKKLQHIWQSGVTSTSDEIAALGISLFANTGSIFEQDPKMAKLFVEDFIGFVGKELNNAGGNMQKVAFRTLPGPDGQLSQTAHDQWLLFGTWVGKDIEKVEAEKLSKAEKARGELNRRQAKKRKDEIMKGKYVVVEGKDRQAKYLPEYALDSTSFWDEVYYEETPQRGKEAFSMNPLSERKGSTRDELKKQVWMNASVMAEKKLMDNGFQIKASFNVDQNGVAYGNVEDNKGTELKVEYGILKKVKFYKFTFVDKPAEKFLVKDDQLNNYFGKGNSAREVYLIKQNEEKRKANMPIRNIKKLLKLAKLSMPMSAAPGAAGQQPSQDAEQPSIDNLDRRGESQRLRGKKTAVVGYSDVGVETRTPVTTPIEQKRKQEQNSKMSEVTRRRDRTDTARPSSGKRASKGKSGTGLKKSRVWTALKPYAYASAAGAGAGVAYYTTIVPSLPQLPGLT